MKMKALMTAALLTLIMCGSAFAQTTFEARGSVVVPGLQAASSPGSTYYDKTSMWLTNINGNEVTCKVTAFDQDGNDVSSMVDVYTGSSTSHGLVLLSSGSGTFTIPAGGTRYLIIWDPDMNKHILGHMIVEWDSDNTTVRKALLAQGKRYTHSSGHLMSESIVINNGEAF